MMESFLPMEIFSFLNLFLRFFAFFSLINKSATSATVIVWNMTKKNAGVNRLPSERVKKSCAYLLQFRSAQVEDIPHNVWRH